MERKTSFKISLFVIIAWTILLPCCISTTIATRLLSQNSSIQFLISKSPVLTGICIVLTGVILGIPLSFSLAKFHNSNSYKWMYVSFGWGFSFLILTVLLWILSSAARYSEEGTASINISNIILGSIFFGAIGFIPGAIGGWIMGSVEQRILQTIYPYRPFLLSMFWALAFFIGNSIAYLMLILQDKFFFSQNGSISNWMIPLSLIVIGVISSAIGSTLTFSSKSVLEK